MRVLFLRRFAFVTLALAMIAVHPARAWAQRPTPRSIAVPVEPIPQTLIEALLTEPNVVVVADYYWVDTRFGPNLRIDAMIVDDATLVWVVHDTNPHALSHKVKKFVQAQHWFQDLTQIGLE